ncbi:MAG: hypothetical protein K5656_09240, partial [Lachnospiraceae bacterium]|nr:hypothetical protein [Lachnospiraceae bacterium]
MKEVETNVKGKAFDYSLSQININDFAPVESTAFKSAMILAGVGNATSNFSMRSLFVYWLMGVKGMSFKEVINTSKLDATKKKELGAEFVNFFKDNAIYGKDLKEEDIKAHARNLASMVYKARLQIFFKEKLTYPNSIMMVNEVSYAGMLKEPFGFAAETEYGMDGVIDNWISFDNNKTPYNPNGVSIGAAFMTGYNSTGKLNPVDNGVKSFTQDQNKVRIVKVVGNVSKKLSDKSLNEEERNHLIKAAKMLPGRISSFKQLDKPSIATKGKHLIENITNNGLCASDTYEAIVNSKPAKGKNLKDNEKFENGVLESINKYNESHVEGVNNAMNIIAHNDNTRLYNLSINKADRFKKGLDLSDANENELKEAADAFDELFAPVNLANYKFIDSSNRNVINNISINGVNVWKMAEDHGQKMNFSQKKMFAKALVIRAFVNDGMHLFYQMGKGSVDPSYEAYSSNESSGMDIKKNSVAIKPEDFKVGLVYDVDVPKYDKDKHGYWGAYIEEADSLVDENTKYKMTKSSDAKLPPVKPSGDIKTAIKNLKLDIPKNLYSEIKPVEEAEAKVPELINRERRATMDLINATFSNNKKDASKPEVKPVVKEEPVGMGEKYSDNINNTNHNTDAEDDDNYINDPINEQDALKAKEYVDAVEKYKVCYKYVVDWLSNMKNVLRFNQEDPEANFGSKNKLEGGKDYQEFTKAIEAALKAFKNPKKDALKLGKVIPTLMKKADNYVFLEDLFVDELNGEPSMVAHDILNKGKTIANMFYNARVGVCTKSIMKDGKETALGNLSYNDITKKATELKETYKDSKAFKKVTKTPTEAELYTISQKQMAIRSRLNKVSRTMNTNYEYTQGYSSKYYNLMSSKHSVTAYARWIVTKEYLDKLYRPGVTVSELDELSNVTNNSLKADIKRLYKSEWFKQLVKNNPDNVYDAYNNYKNDGLVNEFKDAIKDMNEDELVANAAKAYVSYGK